MGKPPCEECEGYLAKLLEDLTHSNKYNRISLEWQRNEWLATLEVKGCGYEGRSMTSSFLALEQARRKIVKHELDLYGYYEMT